MRLRRIGWTVLASLIPALPLASACSDSPSAGADAGVIASGDGGRSVPDAGGADASDGPLADASASIDGAAPMTPEGNLGDADYASECLDGRDQNGFGGIDCSDTSCAAAPSCCIGVGTSTCCRIPGASVVRNFACTTGSCDTLTGFTTFGDVGPVRTSDMAYAPESDHGSDSGAILDTELDPRAAIVTLEATLGVPSTTTDVDAVGVGLLTGGPSAHVVPLAAVVVSGARHEILLLLGESVAARAAAPSDGELHPYALSVDPSGHVVLTSGTLHLEANVTLPAIPVHAAFFGRATNPGAAGAMMPARIGSLSVSSSGCDQPTALTRLGAITIVDHTGAAMLGTAVDPSFATDGTTTVLAFAARAMSGGTGIFLAAREADESYHVRAPAAGTQPILAPPTGDAFESPALAFETGTWTLYATRVHAGVRSLVRAISTTNDVLTMGSALDVSIPGLEGSVSSPAPIPHTDMVVVRHQAPSTELATHPPELLMLTLTGAAGVTNSDLCGAYSTCAEGDRMETQLYAARTATITFDADDIDDPAVVLYGDVYRLYYAGRLGSRWSIGMLISADQSYWRPANAGAPVLSPDGNGYDAVSVRGPAPLVEDGRLSLYYLGSDGDTPTIARAQGGAVVAP